MTRAAPASGAARSRPLALLQVTVLVSTMDRFALPPMLVAVARDLDSPLAAVVQAAGAYFLAYGLSQPMWGLVADRWGRVRTMRVTMLLAGLATIASALSGSVAVLAITRGVAGGLFGAAYPSTLVYLGDTVPAERRQSDVARLMVGVAVGTALASVGAGVLADLVTWRAAFVLTGLASLVVVWMLRSLPEPAADAARVPALRSLAVVGRSPVAGLVIALAFAEGVVLLGCLTLLPPAVEDAGASTTLAGLVTGVYGVAVFLAARLVGRLSRTWHPWRLIALGAGSATVACAALAASRAPLVAVVVAALVGLAWTSMHSSLQTWATEVLPSARALVVSLFAGSLFVGSAAGAGLVGGLAEDGRYGVVFTAYAVLAVPLGVAAAWGRRRWRRPGETAPERAPEPAPGP